MVRTVCDVHRISGYNDCINSRALLLRPSRLLVSTDALSLTEIIYVLHRISDYIVYINGSAQ